VTKYIWQAYDTVAVKSLHSDEQYSTTTDDNKSVRLSASRVSRRWNRSKEAARCVPHHNPTTSHRTISPRDSTDSPA